MIIVIKGLSFNEVHDYLDSRGAGEGDLDIYIDDYGYADADRGDMRRMVEVTGNLDFDEEEFLFEVMNDLEREQPDVEIIDL
tara:strand:+ start:2371 stop:2616 length:246 start_codon:yes stop_codon:yes gene_type:complete